jgi:hypothetical protein
MGFTAMQRIMRSDAPMLVDRYQHFGVQTVCVFLYRRQKYFEDWVNKGIRNVGTKFSNLRNVIQQKKRTMRNSVLKIIEEQS